MIDLVRTAVRFFCIGFVAGALLAPRSGAETRRMIREKLDLAIDQLLELLALPPIEREGAAAEEPAPPSRPRGKSRKAEDKGAGAPAG